MLSTSTIASLGYRSRVVLTFILDSKKKDLRIQNIFHHNLFKNIIGLHLILYLIYYIPLSVLYTAKKKGEF